MTTRDVNKLAVFWKEQAKEAIASARALCNAKQWLHALFFCHLTLEKMLKALVVTHTKSQAPYSHNLTFLAGKTDLPVTKTQLEFLETMNKYNLEGRYPEYRSALQKNIDRATVRAQLQHTQEFIAWCEKHC